MSVTFHVFGARGEPLNLANANAAMLIECSGLSYFADKGQSILIGEVGADDIPIIMEVIERRLDDSFGKNLPTRKPSVTRSVSTVQLADNVIKIKFGDVNFADPGTDEKYMRHKLARLYTLCLTALDLQKPLVWS